MTSNHLKPGVQQAPGTSCIFNMPQTVGIVQHNAGIMSSPFITVVHYSAVTFEEVCVLVIDLLLCK